MALSPVPLIGLRKEGTSPPAFSRIADRCSKSAFGAQKAIKSSDFYSTLDLQLLSLSGSGERFNAKSSQKETIF